MNAVQISLSQEARDYIAANKGNKEMSKKILAALFRAQVFETQRTANYIQERKLNFPSTKKVLGQVVNQPTTMEGLRNVTGRLFGSVETYLRENPTEIEGNRITSTLGTNVPYAIVHEDGFSGTVTVPWHTRRVESRDVYAKTKGKRKKLVSLGMAIVRKHDREMNLPARHMFFNGLMERADEISAALSDAVMSTAGGAAT